jgi:uncharacterized membrane protein
MALLLRGEHTENGKIQDTKKRTSFMKIVTIAGVICSVYSSLCLLLMMLGNMLNTNMKEAFLALGIIVLLLGVISSCVVVMLFVKRTWAFWVAACIVFSFFILFVLWMVIFHPINLSCLS